MHDIDPREFIRIYADGGNFASKTHGASRSEIGAVWAYTYIDKNHNRAVKDSGFIRPNPQIVLDEKTNTVQDTLTNNAAEYYAMLQALKNMPSGFTGIVRSDSKNTIGRFFWNYKTEGIPKEWVDEARKHVRRLGGTQSLQPEVLDGHPTAEQLAAGKGKRGNPVCRHNAWCDDECNRVKLDILDNILSQELSAEEFAWHRKNLLTKQSEDEDEPPTAADMADMLKPKPARAIPIIVNGKAVAEIRNNTLFKKNKREHFIRVPPAIAFDTESFDAHSHLFDKIVVTNVDTAQNYIITTTEFNAKRVILDRGHGVQWMALLGHWSMCGEDGEVLPPPEPPAKKKKEGPSHVNLAFDL
jgi:ribonuclease HI